MKLGIIKEYNRFDKLYFLYVELNQIDQHKIDDKTIEFFF
jgi:hypothetical protein